MNVDFGKLTPSQRYNLIIQTVVPRPIAWTLTQNESGSYNLAPYSYFNIVCADPPTIVLSIGRRRDGTLKDTRANIMRTGQLVVHIASAEMDQQMTESSLPFGPGVSEVEKCQLDVCHDFGASALPRLAQARVAMRCELINSMEIGNTRHLLVIAEVKEAYYSDTLVFGEGDNIKIDAQKLAPLSRIGGDDYAYLGAIKTVLPRAIDLSEI